MREREHEEQPSTEEEARFGSPLFDGIALGRIVAFDGRDPVIVGTPLIPSQPGCAGDTGVVAGKPVVDVIQTPEGVLHVLEGERKLGKKVGDLVLVCRNATRRERLERTHAAVVVVLAQFALLGIEVVSVEIVAGLAWIEIEGPAPPLDLSKPDLRELALRVSPQQNGRMAVQVGSNTVLTYFAPISQSSLDIGPVGIRPVTALEDGREVLEVSLSDEKGRSWWI